MTPFLELRRHKGKLQFARKVLTTALLLQLPFLIEILLRQVDIFFHIDTIGDRHLPERLFWVLHGGTTILAIVGFTIVCRELSLWDGDLEDTELARRTGTRKVAAGVQLFFYLTFLLPLFNLLPVIWARWKASASIRDLDALIPDRRR